MEDTLISLGFTPMDGVTDEFEYNCDEEYVTVLGEMLGIDVDDSIYIHAVLPDYASVEADGEQFDFVLDEIVEALRDIS